jgi:hypothetical protein
VLSLYTRLGYIEKINGGQLIDGWINKIDGWMDGLMDVRACARMHDNVKVCPFRNRTYLLVFDSYTGLAGDGYE